jgi:regulator of sigma E protease
MTVLTSLLAFVVAIGLLVTVHELGHYLVMRWCGVRVLRFAFGFGKVLFSRRDRAGTEWALCLWPLGGYVKPLDTRDETHLAPADRAVAFDTQSVGKRVAMVAAGPVANFLLAILLYAIVFMNGVTEWRPFLAQPLPGTPAAMAGIQADDLVTRVDGEPVDTWMAFQWRLLQAFTDEREVSVAVATTRQGVRDQGVPDRGLLIRVPDGLDIGPALMPALGLRLATPDFEPVIGTIQSGSAAEAAGLRTGDRIERIAGQPVTHWSEVVDAIRGHPDLPMALQLSREGRSVDLTLTPKAVEETGRSGEGGAVRSIGRAGIGPEQDAAVLDRFRIHRESDPLEALRAGVVETCDKSRFTLVMLGQMLVGKASLENLSGPVTIASAAGQTARMGAESFLRFLAIVSLSLGVINLLPLPLLDGGHLMYYFVEILTGKPVSAERQAFLQRFGVVLLGLLMFIALFNDLQRLFN